jgi:hypothetical protein
MTLAVMSNTFHLQNSSLDFKNGFVITYEYHYVHPVTSRGCVRDCLLHHIDQQTAVKTSHTEFRISRNCYMQAEARLCCITWSTSSFSAFWYNHKRGQGIGVKVVSIVLFICFAVYVLLYMHIIYHVFYLYAGTLKHHKSSSPWNMMLLHKSTTEGVLKQTWIETATANRTQ